MTSLVYVGTYTGPERAQGISVFRLDPESGALDPLQTVTGLNSPTFLALHPQFPARPFLYAVERQAEEPGLESGAVSSFAVDPRQGTLTLLNRQPSGGSSPCYVSVHPQGGVVFAANYASGHVASFPVLPDGTLGPPLSVVQHQGSGPVARRQEGPHAHSIGPSPDGRFVLACDLGIDRVMVYRLGPDGQPFGALLANDPPAGVANPGSGPRHFAFHPQLPYVYVVNELDSTVTVYAYDSRTGGLDNVQTVPCLPPDFSGTSHTAQIIAHPSGRFVYASNRGHDSIAVFAVDGASGRLTPTGHTSTEGRVPRNFNVHPAGRLLLAGNQDSGTVVPFRIDPQSGALTPTGRVTETPAPVCIIFRED
jgi:6-phosphogluconolactonase